MAQQQCAICGIYGHKSTLKSGRSMECLYVNNLIKPVRHTRNGRPVYINPNSKREVQRNGPSKWSPCDESKKKAGAAKAATSNDQDPSISGGVTKKNSKSKKKTTNNATPLPLPMPAFP